MWNPREINEELHADLRKIHLRNQLISGIFIGISTVLTIDALLLFFWWI